MTLFTVVYCRRSDGKLVVTGRGRIQETNEPTKDQLDSKPNAKGVSDYYRILGLQDSKHLDWRRKLAGMLVKELGGAEFSNDKAYILDDLPENYRLYEHTKTKAETDKPGKTHAAAGLERQDAYLYGHPGGRKKRYRSPADFFPHLLWLCTDEQGDPMNCACKVCSPDEIQADTKPGIPARGGTVSMKVDNQQVVGRNPIVEIPARPPSQTTPNTAFSRPSPSTSSSATVAASPKPQTPQTAPSTQAQHLAQRQAMSQAMPAPPKSADQVVDLTYGRMNFRVGELVWYNVGATWALGIISRRWTIRTQPLPSGRRYMIQPLAAPHQPQQQVIVNAESSMRPWLAWSAPAFCHPRLNQGIPPTFNTMDWSALVNGHYGESNPDIVKIDASILAARAIDGSYTPFGYISNNTLPISKPGSNPHFTTHRLYWNGIYLGGERIWLGDPVRLRISPNEDVLVVKQIIETPADQPTPATPTKIMLVGDIFSCSTLASDALSADKMQLLPDRMRQDLEARNRAIHGMGIPKSYWKLLKTGQPAEISEIKGRWYETSLMAPIVNNQASYEDCIRSGQTDSVARSFNMRADMNRSAGTRCEPRPQAFGRAVPDSMRLIEGLDEPAANELPRSAQPPQQQPQAQPQAQQTPIQSEFDAQMAEHDDQGDGIDQYMDLGGMEDHNSMPDFGQEYGSQGSYFNP